MCLSNLRTEHLKWVNLLHVNFTSINLTLKFKKIFLKSPPPPKMASPPTRSTSGTSSTFQPGPQPWYLCCNWFLSYNTNNKQLQSHTNCSFIKTPKPLFASAFPLFLFCPHHYLHLAGLLWQPWLASLLEWPVPLLLGGCIRNAHFLTAFSCLELSCIPHSLPIGLTPPSPPALTLASFFILIYHHPPINTLCTVASQYFFSLHEEGAVLGTSYAKLSTVSGILLFHSSLSQHSHPYRLCKHTITLEKLSWNLCLGSTSFCVSSWYPMYIPWTQNLLNIKL